MDNKLTYWYICSLAAQGRFNEIPSSYDIIWFGPQPQKVFDHEVDGECIKITQNEFAIPNKIKVSGEYTVKVPEPSSIIANEKPCEFGDIWINTVFTLTELKFIYETKENIEKLTPYIETYLRMINGREILKKKDVVFDAELTLPDFQLDIKNLYIKSYESENENNVIIDLNYDYQI